MSLNLTRRDAIKGAVVASAALAAAPYLGNLAGGFQAADKAAPAKTAGNPAPAIARGATARAEDTTILYIKGDVVKSYSGRQSVKVQDAELASKLRGAIQARLD
jgi:hypothetical protein